MAFLLVWSSLSADLPEQLATLHQSLVNLRTKLTTLQQQLDDLKNKLNPQVIQNSIDDPAPFIKFAVGELNKYGDQHFVIDIEDNSNDFYELGLKLSEKVSAGNAITNIKENLKIIHSDQEAALETFYAAIYLGIPFNNLMKQEDHKNKQNLEEFYKALRNDSATSAEEARFKAMWYGAISEIIKKTTSTKKIDAHLKLIDNATPPSQAELEQLNNIFNSYDPTDKLNKPQHITTWVNNNKATIEDVLKKSATHELNERLIDFLDKNDLSYLHSEAFSGKNGFDVLYAINSYLSSAVENNTDFAHQFFMGIIKIMSTKDIMSPSGQERIKYRHQIMTLCSILLKNHYYESWLIKLMFDLLVRETAPEYVPVFIEAFHFMPKESIHLILAHIHDIDNKDDQEYEITIPNSLEKIKIQNKLRTAGYSKDNLSKIFNKIASLLIDKIAYEKAQEFTLHIIHPQPAQPAPVQPQPAVAHPAVIIEPAKVPGINVQAIEKIHNNYLAWQQQNIATKDDYSKIAQLLNYFIQIKNILPPHDQSYKKTLSDCSNIVEQILKSKDMLEWLIQEAGFIQTNNLFKQLVEFVVWMINEAGQDYFLNNLDRITSNNLDVADASLYMLVQRNNLNAIVYQENLVKHLILGLAGNPNQKKAAQEVFVKIPAMGSIYRRKLATWFRELGGEAAV